MRKFIFPLESVMEWRRVTAETEETRLAAITQELHRLEATLVALDQQRRSAELHVAAQKTVEARDLAALDTYRIHIEGSKRRYRAAIEECRRKVAAQLQRVKEARRAFRLLELLRDKNLAQWRKEYDRELETQATELHLAKRARSG